MRICSNETLFEERLGELRNEFLIPRNYKAKIIDAEFEKVRNLPGDSFTTRGRQALLKVKKMVEDTQRIIAPVDFNPHLPNIRQIFKNPDKAMLINAPYLGEIFKSPPMAI